VVSAETPQRRAYVAQVLSQLLRLMGQGEVPLEFEEREDGQLAVALHIAFADSPLKASAAPKRSPLLNALQFLLNRLLKRAGEGPQTPAACGKVLLGVDGFPPPPSPPKPPQAKGPEACEAAPAALPCENVQALSSLATCLAHKALAHSRIYAVLLLGRAQRACMQQAAEALHGLRTFSEGEAHWSRLVFHPDKPLPMPQKSRIAFHKEALANKSPRALAS